MRCLVGVMAFAALALGGIQTASAASFVSPTICTNTDGTGIDTCNSGITGLSQSFGGNTTNDFVTNTPLAVTVNGNPFDVQTDTLSLNEGESATIRMEIRNFDRVWFDGEGINPAPNGPTFISGVGTQVANFFYLSSDTGYTIPVNINTAANTNLKVSVVGAGVDNQPEGIIIGSGGVLPPGTEAQTTDFTGQIPAPIGSISVQDSGMNSLESTGQNAFRLADFLNQPGGPAPLELFTVLASGDLALVLQDVGTPQSFHLEIQVEALSVQPVPLPAAAWLFLSGIGALLGFRRFRNKAA